MVIHIYITECESLLWLLDMRQELFAVTRRGQMDIISDILRATKEGKGKTQIIFQARLNYMQCDKYLKLMIRKGLIEVEKQGNRVLYRTSKIGAEYLREYNKLREFLT